MQEEDRMKRIVLALLLANGLVPLASPAHAARVRVVHRGHARTRVVITRGFPLRRTLPVVVVRPVRGTIVVRPRAYLAPVVWAATVVSLPGPDRLVWEDSETLSKDEDWTELTFAVNDRGEALFIQVDGKAELDFGEVVFENGDTQVVDMKERIREPGIYSLLDFRDGRKVSHVRLIARARSDEAKLVLRMEK
jgi:hypothetical protein